VATLNDTTAATAVARARGGVRPWQPLAVVVVIVLAAAVPFVVSDYRLFQLTQVLVYAMAVLGLNMLTGFNGQISLGHGAFYAIGAYTTAILLDQTGVPYWATVPIAGAICLCVGYLFGLPALRLEGFYLALATFALAVATPQLLKYKALDHWTGGVQGVLVALPDPPDWVQPIMALLKLPAMQGSQWLYMLCLAWTVFLFVIAWNLLRGRTGRSMIAIRDHPVAAATMGIDTAIYKASTFGVSAMYTGVAGALGALLAQFVSPDSFDPFLSVRFLVGSVVGGVFSISGAFIGAAFIQFLPNLADSASKLAPEIMFGWVLVALGAIGIVWTGWLSMRRAAAFGRLVGPVLGALSIAAAVVGAGFLLLPGWAGWAPKVVPPPQVIYGVVLIALMYVMPSGAMGLIRIAGARLKHVMAAPPGIHGNVSSATGAKEREHVGS
jgi:branched-chain amino acid transport system permease protein